MSVRRRIVARFLQQLTLIGVLFGISTWLHWPLVILVGIGFAVSGVMMLAQAGQPTFWDILTLRMIRQLRSDGFSIRLLPTRFIGLIYIFVGISCLTSVRYVFARSSTTAAAASINDSAARIEPAGTSTTLEAKVLLRAQKFMAKNHNVGLAIGVLDRNTSFALSFGSTRFGTNDIPNSATLFEIGSISKTFTATVLAKMVNSGTLKLDEPLEDALGMAVPEKDGRKITLVDLATHTSGLPRIPAAVVLSPRMIFPSFWRDPYAHFTDDDMANWLAGYKLSRIPGEKSDYSNIGFGLLGWALSKKAGCTYEQMIRREIGDPLGLADTFEYLSPEQRERFAHGYSSFSTTGPVRLANENGPWTMHDCFAGCGALRSNVRDLLLYAKANMATSSSTISEAIRETHKPRFAVNAVTSVGLAWMTTMRPDLPAPVIWHNGGTGGYRSFIGFMPEKQCAVVLLTNCVNDNGDWFGFDILQLIVANRGKKQPRVSKAAAETTTTETISTGAAESP